MDVTLLKKKQIWGSDALDVIKKYGTKTALTDLALVLGGFQSRNFKRTIEGDCSGIIWTATLSSWGEAYIVNDKGKMKKDYQDEWEGAIRPVLPPSETSKICPRATRLKHLENGETVDIVEFGMYPQTVADSSVSNVLEKDFKRGTLETLKKSFTFDGGQYYAFDWSFEPLEHPVYQKDGRHYIRVISRLLCRSYNVNLSDGTLVKMETPYWIELEPIEWLKDRSGFWVSKKALFAGIPMDPSEDGKKKFEETVMKEYLNTYFSKEMVHGIEYSLPKEKMTKRSDKKSRRSAPGIQVVDEPLSIKEQIDFYVQKGMSFMLHGPSGIGKTARVEQIDPNLTAVPLWNGVLPEDIVGKVRYPDGRTGSAEDEKTGVWVPPDWYTELCRKCTKEPHKKHILFIDEVTNAKPTTQSLIFHTVLKKSITPSKGKLPDNAVVVLAGNSVQESGAAYNMPEPLFRRMSGHIYLKPDLPAWLEWGSEKSMKHPEDPNRMNIHPLVASFVGTYGAQIFYSAYDEENPKDWAVDPRGWEQISDIVYDNKGIIRRELFENKMGSEMASAFLAFAKHPPLSLEEILNNSYTSEDIPRVSDAKLALTLSLRHVPEHQVKQVRKFIERKLGKENLAIFDSLWVNRDEDRALYVAGLKQNGGR